MRHQKGGACQELHDEVAIAHGVHAVQVNAVKLQQLGDESAVDRECGASQRTRPERQHVYPFPAVAHPLDVALQHGHIRHHMVAEEDRLGPLQVCVARHHRIQVAARLLQQRLLQIHGKLDDLHQLFPQIQVHIESYLIIAAPSRVQLAADRTDLFDQHLFYVHMHIFVGHEKLHLAPFDFFLYLLQAGNNLPDLIHRQDAALAQHRHVSQAADDILPPHLLVERDGSCIFFYKLIRRLREASSPQFHCTIASFSSKILIGVFIFSCSTPSFT